MDQPRLSEEIAQSVELEAAMLSRLISEPTAALEVMHLLTEECFTLPVHRSLFQAIAQLYASGVVVTMLSLGEHLRSTLGELPAKQIIATVATTIFGRHDDPNPSAYLAQGLLNYAKRRKLTDVSVRLNRLISDPSYDLDQGTAEVQQLLDQVLSDTSADAVVPLTRVLEEVRLITIDNQSPLTHHIGVMCGLPEIDREGGLPADGLVIVGAKSSHGKTTFAINVAVYALLQGQRVACFSLEMTRERVAGRIVSMRSGVNSNAIMRQCLPPHELERTHQTITELQQSVADNFYFDNRNAHDISALQMMIRQLVKAQGVSLVVIDYAQLVEAPAAHAYETDNKLLADLSHKLHNLARDLHVCILLLSQVNRSVTGMPTLSCLRGSGEMEEAADMVLLLYNACHAKTSFEAPFDGIDPKGKLLVDVAKSRDGAQMTFLVGFEPSQTLIYSLTPKELTPLPQEWSLFE